MTVTFESILDQLESGEIKTGIYLSSRKAWFKYCYHFSHVENVVSILNDGRLLSRNQAILEGKMRNDNASREIIEQTNSEYKDYVRLYFRPKSPTQFHNEGFKTKEQLEISQFDAQCPVPVFLFLDIRKILTHPNCLFTATSLASSDEVSLYSTPEEFRRLPFDKIYHDRSLTPDEKRSIVGHRHAEIIFPHSLPLKDYLNKIVVRTPAEKETLLTIMGEELRAEYERFIQIDTTNNVFFSRWTYFHTVKLDTDHINFDLRVSQEKNQNKPIKFDFEVELTESDGTIRKHKIENWQPKQGISFTDSREEYEVAFRFDGHLMYKGRYKKSEELPF